MRALLLCIALLHQNKKKSLSTLVASRRAAEVTLSLIIVSAASRWHDDAMAEVQWRLVDSWFGVGPSSRDSPAGFRG